MPFTVNGADGRKIVKGASETEARSLAHGVNENTGETVTITDEETGDSFDLFVPEPKKK